MLATGEELQIGRFKLLFVGDGGRWAWTPVTTHTIGEVLNRLKDEFDDITISKIRFLEAEGLINPDRTESGYRKFTGDGRRPAALRAAGPAGPLPAAEGHQGRARADRRRACRRRALAEPVGRRRCRAGADGPGRPAADPDARPLLGPGAPTCS